MIFTVLVVEPLLKCSLSHNFRDIKGRLLTGRKFLRTKSRQRFISKGITSAAFQLSGTRPVTRDILTISVMKGTSASRQDFSSHVGTGSSWLDALVNSRMILGDVFNDTAEKWCNFSTAFTARSGGSWTWILFRSSLMSSIFVTKEANSFASLVALLRIKSSEALPLIRTRCCDQIQTNQTIFRRCDWLQNILRGRLGEWHARSRHTRH